MPPGTTSLRTFLLFMLLYFGSIFTIAACSGLEENYMNPNADYLMGGYYEKEVQARVTNEWLSGTKRVVRLKVINIADDYSFSDFGDSINIDETYWGSLNLTPGGCVKVWANLRKRKSGKEHIFVLFGDRNPTLCKN